jgi:hypothetical protein
LANFLVLAALPERLNCGIVSACGEEESQKKVDAMFGKSQT